MQPLRIFERLEERLSLAGNVTAAVVNGVLEITGDDSNNQIQLRQRASGDVELSGLRTQINGQRNFISSEDVNGIHIDLGAGRDSMRFSNGELTGDLSIASSAGSDLLSVQRVSVGGDLGITLGAESESVLLDQVNVAGDSALDLGGGNDTLSLSRSTITGNVTADASAGNDRMNFGRLSIGGDLSLDAGDGSDLFAIHQSELNGLTVAGGLGFDNVLIDRVMAESESSIDLGVGRDRLFITRSNFAAGISISPDAMDLVVTRDFDRSGNASGATEATPSSPSRTVGVKVTSLTPPGVTSNGGEQTSTTFPQRYDRWGNPISEVRYQELLRLLGGQWFEGGIGM